MQRKSSGSSNWVLRKDPYPWKTSAGCSGMPRERAAHKAAAVGDLRIHHALGGERAIRLREGVSPHALQDTIILESHKRLKESLMLKENVEGTPSSRKSVPGSRKGYLTIDSSAS